MKPTATGRICQDICVAVVLLTLYVLSMGPAVWLYERSTPKVQRVLEVAYYPLEYIPPDSPFGGLLLQYMRLFE